MSNDDPGSMDEDFRAVPFGQEIELSGGVIAGGVRMEAASVPVSGGGYLPGVVFRFAAADGSGFHAPIALVMTDVQMMGLIRLVRASVVAAVEASQSMRPGPATGN